MKHLKKLNFVVLPLAIWATMIFYHGIILKPFSDLMMNISAPFVLSFCSSYYCPIARNKLADSDGSKEARL